MNTAIPRQRTTSLRSVIERAAGMHTAPVAGTIVILFGECDREAHDRCPEHKAIGVTTYLCCCDCHLGIDPAEWDAAYGSPWGVAVDEGE